MKLHTQDRAHQWICPNPNCTPVYCKGLANNIPIIENRFCVISGNTDEIILPKIKKDIITPQPTETEQGNSLETKKLF